MKRNRRFFAVVLAILTGLVFTAVFSCDTGGGGGSSGPTESYTGKDIDGIEYELIVTGNDYELKIDGKSISTGQISKNGDFWTLMPNGIDGSSTYDFDVTIEGEFIADIGGVIIPDEKGGAPITPGQIVPPGPPTWIWYVSDDYKTNEYLNGRPDEGSAQTVYPPGGVSMINYMNKKDSNGDWEMDGNEMAKKPVEYGGDNTYTGGRNSKAYTEGEYTKEMPKDKNGNEVEGPVFHLKGKVNVIEDNRLATNGAQFPMVGMGAIAYDKKAKDQLRRAWGYSFWIKVNSTSGENNWAFVTAVLTDMPEELGWEYKHWFGSWKGASGCDYVDQTIKGFKVPQNWTEMPTADGKWHQITVVLDKNDPKFNMAQDHYIYQWNNGRMRDLNQGTATQIQWQIPLQHQKPTQKGGDDHLSGPCNVKERGSSPYDVTHGSFEYDFDFCGFEVLMTKP